MKAKRSSHQAARAGHRALSSRRLAMGARWGGWVEVSFGVVVVEQV
jgi:hypothetical protein